MNTKHYFLLTAFIGNLILLGVLLRISIIGIALAIIFLLTIVLGLQALDNTVEQEGESKSKAFNKRFSLPLIILVSILVIISVATEDDNIMKYFFSSLLMIVQATLFYRLIENDSERD